MLNGVAGVTAGDLNTVLYACSTALPDAALVVDAYSNLPQQPGALANLGFAAANFQACSCHPDHQPYLSRGPAPGPAVLPPVV